jgi:hypothetical protein
MPEAEQRADADRNGQPPSQDEPTAGEKPEGFQRFEDLTRKLLRVPKSELDEKRRAPKPSPSTPRT